MKKKLIYIIIINNYNKSIFNKNVKVIIILIIYIMLQSQYPSLTQNGKLFPSWIVYNFKKYKIPKQTLATDIDGCIQQEKQAKLELRNYQIFLSKYLDYNSNIPFIRPKFLNFHTINI